MIGRIGRWFRSRWKWIAAGIGAGLAAVLAVIWRRKPKPAPPPVGMTPEQGKAAKDAASATAQSTVEAIQAQVEKDKAAGRAKYGEPDQ